MQVLGGVMAVVVAALVALACGKDDVTPMGATTGMTTGVQTSEPTTGTGAPEGTFCAQACKEDTDCKVDGKGDSICSADQRCVDPDHPRCTQDDECIAAFNRWSEPCTASDDPACLDNVFGDSKATCLDIGGGVGRCAVVVNPAFPCDTVFDEVEISWPTIEGGMVDVCVEARPSKCDDAQNCFLGCRNDADCVRSTNSGSPTPHCNADSVCVCQSDADCVDYHGAGACLMGSCGCVTDADCGGDLGKGDRCFAGACGCSDVAICDPDPFPHFDGTSVVCAPSPGMSKI